MARLFIKIKDALSLASIYKTSHFKYVFSSFYKLLVLTQTGSSLMFLVLILTFLQWFQPHAVLYSFYFQLLKKFVFCSVSFTTIVLFVLKNFSKLDFVYGFDILSNRG